MTTIPIRSGNVEIDEAARTITITRKITSATWQTNNSTWTIPAGAVEHVEVSEGGFMRKPYVRLILRDYAGYCPLPAHDLNYMSPKDVDVKELAGAIQQLVNSTPALESSGLTPKVGYPGSELELMATRAKAAQFDSLVVDDRVVFCEGQSAPLSGAKAEIVDADTARTRMTATRVLGGAVLFGPLGALVGGMAKKNVGQVYVLVTTEDGRMFSASAKSKETGKAAELVSRINAAR